MASILLWEDRSRSGRGRALTNWGTFVEPVSNRLMHWPVGNRPHVILPEALTIVILSAALKEEKKNLANTARTIDKDCKHPENKAKAEGYVGLAWFCPSLMTSIRTLFQNGITNMHTTPEVLAERCLRSNSHLAMKKLTCAYLNGVLVLRGRVDTYFLKQVAQVAVAEVVGIERIDNQIEVVTPLSRSRQNGN